MAIHQDSKTLIDEDEIDFSKILKILSLYKWIIISITFIFILIANIFLYFKPPVYSAYTIIKVKNSRGLNSKNLVLKPKSLIESNVKEDITLLQTFYMNNQALNLNRVKLDVKYYINKSYKTSEVFNLVPIEIKDIEIINRSILGKKLLITPTENGYRISFKYSFLEKLKSHILGKTLFKFEKNEILNYNKPVSNKYIKFKVDKLSNFDNPIIITFNGTNRDIYENIIKNNLGIDQLDIDVPIIKISYKDNIQQRAISYIDSLTESFIKESIKNKSEQNHELLIMKERLTKSEKSLERYQVENNALEPSLQASTFIKELSEMEIELSENQLREKLAKNLMKFIENDYNLDSIAPSLMELGEKPTLKLIEILQESQLKKDMLLVDFTEKHPKVIEEQNKIDSARFKIIKNIKNLQRHISQKNRTLKRLKLSYENKIKSLPTKERKLINIKRDYEVSSKMYNFLLKKQAENEIEKVATLSDYKIIDKAYSSNTPISPNSKMIIITFTILGLIIGLFIAFIYNFFDNKIRERKDIESSTSLPIYGTLIWDHSKKIIVYDNPNSFFTDSYRALRSKLQLLLNHNSSSCKTVLITSTVSGEGKNIASANLSAILQMANYKTIAIDFDLREPTFDKLFNIKDVTYGLSSYLKGESNIYDIIYSSTYDNLDVIPVGDIPSNPSELILSDYIYKFIEELRKKYDYIVINSTPFGAITDTRHIMSCSDVNLVIFREEYSEKRYITNLDNITREDGIKNIGVVYIQNSEKIKGLLS